MFRKGKPVREIACSLGLPSHRVSSAISRGRAKGALPPRDQDFTNPYLFRKFGIKAGGVSMILENLAPEQKVWLFEEASKIGCETIAEYLLERVRDDYEEHDQRKRGGEEA